MRVLSLSMGCALMWVGCTTNVDHEDAGGGTTSSSGAGSGSSVGGSSGGGSGSGTSAPGSSSLQAQSSSAPTSSATSISSSSGAADGGAGDAGPGPDGGTDNITVYRDDRGIPHIYADTLEAAFHGLGYAMAEDRLWQMHFRRIYMQGRLSEFFAVTPDSPANVQFNQRILDSDINMRTVGYAVFAAQHVAALPADVRSLLDAFSSGVNTYVSRQGIGAHPAFAQSGMSQLEPWTPAHSLLAWEYVGAVFGGSNVDAEITSLLACESSSGCSPPPCGGGPEPVDDGAAVVPPPAGGTWPPPLALQDPPPVWGERPRETPLKASHGWVVAGSRTTTGKPVLVAEPQLELTAPSPWYEFHVSAGGVDARGVTFPGAPGLVVGWNDHVAQTLTAGGGDIADLFELLPGSRPNTYMLDGVETALRSRQESIAVKNASARPLQVLTSHFGPVVTATLAGATQLGSRMFALRHVEHFIPGRHSVAAAINILRAGSLHEYQGALRDWMTPTVNALYAGVDAQDPQGSGHIAYHALGGVPQRAGLTVQGQDYRGRHPYDGSTTASDWTGLYDINWHPHVIDPPQGYLYSANHMPVGRWLDAFMYGGYASNGHTFRSFQLDHILRQALSNPTSTVSPQEVHLMRMDKGAESVRIFRDILEYARQRGDVVVPTDPNAVAVTRQEMAGKVLYALNAWLRQGGELSHADPTWPLISQLMGQMISKARIQQNPAFACAWGGAAGGYIHMARTFDADPAGTYGPTVLDFLLDAATTAWAEVVDPQGLALSQNPNAWTGTVPPPATTHRYQVNWVCMRPGAGTDCSLDPQHEFTAQYNYAMGNSIISAVASSYPALVDFSDLEASRSLLPPGESEVPSSARFRDAVPRAEAKGRGEPDFLPVAPRARGTVSVSATQTFTLRFP